MAEARQATAAGFTAPHPGSSAMPRWTTGELIDAPRFTWRHWFAMLGPGLLMAGSAIGGGEWLTGPLVTARYGGALLWLATLSILAQVVYNMELCRYTLYSGEPIFTGKFRTPPGPRFWLVLYLFLDFGSVFPYLAASAATPAATIALGYVPDKDHPLPVEWLGISDVTLLNVLGYAIFLLALVPLVFGGKIYNSLKAVMTFKIVAVFGFLLVLAAFYSKPDTWTEIFSGFARFGNVPINRVDDANGNGVLDPGEDFDGDGHLDVIEQKYPKTVDADGDGNFDAWEDRTGDGRPDKFEDVDGDGIRDGDNVDNIFVSLWEGRGFPLIDLSVLGLLCAMVAISGQGGLSNTPVSNYTREQGWGMGHHVGAIPSVVGGQHLALSHVGCVFQVTAESQARWKRWYRHVMRDQLVIWLPACFIGLALPSMLSVQFLRRGTEASPWTAAGMTAQGVEDSVASQSGAAMGHWFWFLTLFCGFLVLAPSMAGSADGVIRRWVDVFWTSSARLREVDPRRIRYVYFSVLCGYAVFGVLVLAFVPGEKLMVFASIIFNWAIGFSIWHTLGVNCLLLPRELQPGWFVRVAMVLGGLFFVVIAAMATYAKLREVGWV